MVKYGELDQVLSTYIHGDTHDAIPVEYYRLVIKATIQANNEGKQWDMQQAAAVLLHFAFNDGVLTPSQLTTDGLKALDHAEVYLQEIEIAIESIDKKNSHSA